MSMIRQGASFNNSVVEVLDGSVLCEKCNQPLNLLTSQNGEVQCDKCTYPNKVENMESEDV